MKVKVCGMRDPENLRQIAALRPDYLGFIFYKGSKRYCDGTITPELLAELPATIKKVGVFVNEATETIVEIARKFKLDLIQLHGHESPKQCQEIKNAGFEVIKAFSVDDRFVFENTLLYERSCDYFLFDTKGDSHGGNGIPFDWELIKNYLSPTPYFLSGGLNLENIKNLEKVRPKPFAIDVNSGFELEPGLKDVEEVKLLLEQTKNRN
ncbi:phosphoribosylanthranilate isomerase [Pontibacter sp. BT310]|uniref:N-(5'-phosphoribosyl)anthranilate isomerase n=1 Tax=Pontibacter populi TaxID=890055 RepID=A0ABS6X9T3_9BACT|nr:MULTISPECIES: phosphoribosylanthranilate isomerase [Pontibacter]MBJ6117899.1 phosphoribosylanthranilate isomerase [Pontibacter sp. BT310]MBR0570326.1 phosphoribosylanthranilate isomerase [Microvirga sp. STS03]MBW3364752.1 phosphoribosylanthranilate isomerase [Pontibacter populi]